MRIERPTLVVAGEVVLAAMPDRLERAEAIGIAGGRVATAGTRREVLDTAAPGAQVIDMGALAVIPGLHDFHLHLVGMARARRAVRLNEAADFGELCDRVAAAAAALPSGAWLTGRGWDEDQIDPRRLALLEAAVGERPALLTSHDGHSAWASAAARAAGGVRTATPDPPGGRVERDASGAPTGIFREAALDQVAVVADRLRGEALWSSLDETLRELAAKGITGMTDAGDYTDANGVGRFAAMGDSFSTLAELAGRLDGRARLTLDLPADALSAATERGLRTGQRLDTTRTLRVGWAKAYADGALGSRTAALFEPYTCGDGLQVGILRLDPDRLDAILAAGRRAGIGLAVHAIGDRAVATVLDAVERAPRRASGAAADRMEHAQLVRPIDRPRFGPAGVVASVQPIHAAADRDAVVRCWAGREADAYAWRSLAASGALLAFGSDAPVESWEPWAGFFVAVHRRRPGDARPDWLPGEALDPIGALSAYTLGPARAIGADDEGHLRPGARADLAVLDLGLDALLEAGDEASRASSQLTLVGGREVHRS